MVDLLLYSSILVSATQLCNRQSAVLYSTEREKNQYILVDCRSGSGAKEMILIWVQNRIKDYPVSCEYQGRNKYVIIFCKLLIFESFLLPSKIRKRKNSYAQNFCHEIFYLNFLPQWIKRVCELFCFRKIFNSNVHKSLVSLSTGSV